MKLSTHLSAETLSRLEEAFAAHPRSTLSPEATARSLPKGLAPSRIPLTIVCGPPASGKSTYVAERIGSNDLLIDLDDILQALTGVPGHAAPRWALPAALDQRNKMLAALADDRAHDRAWFIVGAPREAERRHWAKMLDGEVVVLATPAEVCVGRIEADPGRQRRRTAQIEAVGKWWGFYISG